MEPAAPPAANQATTASADFFVVPPVRQTYATGFGARAVPKMGRRRKQRKWRKSALAYLLQRPARPPPRARPASTNRASQPIHALVPRRSMCCTSQLPRQASSP